MMTERDTHFLGFAELLYAELVQNSLHSDKGLSDVEAFKQEQHTLIAQRAYDLAVHVINNLSYHDFEPYTYEVAKEEIAEEDADILSHIPDLTEWPPTETEQ